MAESVRYSEAVTIRCQPEVAGLLDVAARAKGQKPSEWTRQALMAALRADGFEPAQVSHGDRQSRAI